MVDEHRKQGKASNKHDAEDIEDESEPSVGSDVSIAGGSVPILQCVKAVQKPLLGRQSSYRPKTLQGCREVIVNGISRCKQNHTVRHLTR